MRIRKGDTVQIIAGNDRGKKGKVLAVFPGTGRIVVEGAAIRAKHIRPRAHGKKGEIVRSPAPIPASRAMLVCSNCAKPVRVSHRREGAVKTRICRRCGKTL